MKLSLPGKDLTKYLLRQINNTFPDEVVGYERLKRGIDIALERTYYCFAASNNTYFRQDGEPFFNHLHTDQYAIFLYYVSNSLHYETSDTTLASKIYALNKSLHAIDMYYEVELPKIFFLQHPVGTVLGRADYSNHLIVYSRCNVGSNLEGISPRIGDGVVMFGGSGIIGDCSIGDNCWLSVNTLVMDQDIPANSIVFGQSPHIIIKPTGRNVVKELFLGNTFNNDSDGDRLKDERRSI